MAKRKQEVKLQYDPTMPTSEIKIGDTTYRLCFDFDALASAEVEMWRAGIDCNILASIRLNSISAVRTMFAASLRRHHPNLSWSDACALVTWQTYPSISGVVGYGLTEALVPPKENEGDEANPPKP